jgi:hypothetical protein
MFLVVVRNDGAPRFSRNITRTNNVIASPPFKSKSAGMQPMAPQLISHSIVYLEGGKIVIRRKRGLKAVMPNAELPRLIRLRLDSDFVSCATGRIAKRAAGRCLERLGTGSEAIYKAPRA